MGEKGEKEKEIYFVICILNNRMERGRKRIEFVFLCLCDGTRQTIQRNIYKVEECRENDKIMGKFQCIETVQCLKEEKRIMRVDMRFNSDFYFLSPIFLHFLLMCVCVCMEETMF